MLYLNSTESKPVALTAPTDGAMDYNPVFSLDGRSLYFLSNRDKQFGVQIYGIPMSQAPTAQPARLTQLPDVGIDNLKVHSKFMIFTVEVYLECKGDLDCTKQKNDEFDSRGWLEYDQLYVLL